jgi:hypothetical protein
MNCATGWGRGGSRREVLIALMDFLMAHEPDLLACAEALAVKPEALVDAHAAVRRGQCRRLGSA